MWVVTYYGSTPDVHGPATMTTVEREQLRQSLACVFVVMVDAQTAVAAESNQFCRRL